MAFTFIQSKIAKGNSISSLAVTGMTIAAGHLLVVQTLVFDGTSPSQPTGVAANNGDTFTLFPGSSSTCTGAFAGVKSSWWYLPATSNGSATAVTITWPASNSFAEMGFWDCSYAAAPILDGFTQDPGGLGGSVTSGTTATGPAVSTTGTAGVVFAAAGAGGSFNAMIASGSWVNDGFSGGASGDAWGHLITTANGTQAAPKWTDTVSSDNVFINAIAFYETGSAPSSVFVPRNTYMAPILTQ